jgi:hypothetical protein
MTCHVASVAHMLPAKDEMEVDPTMNDNELREAKKRVDRDHQRRIEEDDETRDILWPLEQVHPFPRYRCILMIRPFMARLIPLWWIRHSWNLLLWNRPSKMDSRIQ